MTRTDLIRIIQASSVHMRDAWARLQRHPDDPGAQNSFHQELQRHPEVLEAWQEYHFQTAEVAGG